MWCIYHIINFINNTDMTVNRSININASAIEMPVISCGIITIGIYVPLIIVIPIKKNRNRLTYDKYTSAKHKEVPKNLYLMFCEHRKTRSISDINFF